MLMTDYKNLNFTFKTETQYDQFKWYYRNKIDNVNMENVNKMFQKFERVEHPQFYTSFGLIFKLFNA